MIKKLKIEKKHVDAALEGYLKAMSMIDDNDTVVEVTGSGTHVTVLVEREAR